MDEKLTILTIFLAAFLCFAAGFFSGKKQTMMRYRKEAINRGVAAYHPETGDWQWLEKDKGGRDDE